MIRAVSLLSLLACCSLAVDARAQDEADPPTPERPAPEEPAPEEPTPTTTAQPSTQAAPAPTGPAPTSATPPEPAPPRVAVVRRQAPRPASCSPEAIAAVMEASRPALVRVEAPGARGLGFVVQSPSFVVTASSLVEVGRGIEVVVDGDERHDATVIRIDRARGLALLELAAPASATPLPLAVEPPAIGDPLLVLAEADDHRGRRGKGRARHRAHHRDHHASDDVIRAGIVSSRTGMSLRSDAIDGRILAWGAPALSCDGRVAAVAINPHNDELVAATAVRQLTGRGDEEGYDGRWSLLHPSLSFVGQIDHQPHPDFGFEEHDKWLGFSLGTALIGKDRWYFPLRFAATFLVGPDFDEPFTDRSGYRLLGSVGAGYRFMISSGRVPIYLVPTLGFTGMYERTKLTTLALSVDPDCGGETCPVEPREIEQTARRWRPLPTAGLGLQVGFGELSYQILVDPEDRSRSIHQLTVGGQW